MSELRLLPALDGDGLNRKRQSYAGGYEVYEDVLYDTVTYLAAGPAAGGSLNFFANQANTGDRTLTNFTTPGQLPSPQRFWVQRMFLQPIIETTVTAGALDSTGRVRDLERVVTTSRAFLTYSNSVTNRTRGPIPLSMLGGVGGVVPVFGGNNTPAAGANAVFQSARLHAHGGYPLDLVVNPSEQLSFSIVFGVNVAITADMPIRLVLYGWRYMKS